MATDLRIQDITLTRRDTEIVSGTVKDSTGVVYDITGYSIKMTIKRNYTDSDADALMGPVSGVIVSGVAGTYTVSLTRTNTDITPGEYFYDIQIYLADYSVVKTVNYGRCTILGDVTKTPN